MVSAWPLTTWTDAALPRCVTGMPAACGTETTLVRPGTTSTGDAGREARRDLFAAAAVDERVAALEPHDAPAGAGVLDEQAR